MITKIENLTRDFTLKYAIAELNIWSELFATTLLITPEL